MERITKFFTSLGGVLTSLAAIVGGVVALYVAFGGGGHKSSNPPPPPAVTTASNATLEDWRSEAESICRDADSQVIALGPSPTVTDDSGVATIKAANGLRIRIQAGLSMTWDTTVTTVTLSGTASAKVSTAVTFLDHKLRRLLSIELPQTDQSAPDAGRPISRIALRQILLEGLEDIVSFGKTFDAFETAPDGHVIARLQHRSELL